MELTLEQQTEAFLWSFVLGAVMAVIYIIIAVIRVLSPPTKIQIFISDILFMVFSALVNFIFAVTFTEGNLRLYTVFAELISFFAIYLTVGSFLKKITYILYKWISALFCKIISPIIAIFHKLLYSIKKYCSFVLEKVKKLHFPLHCQHKMLYNTNNKSAKR